MTDISKLSFKELQQLEKQIEERKELLKQSKDCIEGYKITFCVKFNPAEHQFDELIKIDETLKRPIEIRKTLGNPQKIQNLLGWKAKTNFIDLINEMVDHDIALFKDSNLNH